MSDVPVIFVSNIAQAGFRNGIYNVSFSTARYVPQPDPRDVTGQTMIASAAEFISVNLRMDLFCMQQLHDSLAGILAEQVKPASKEMN